MTTTHAPSVSPKPYGDDAEGETERPLRQKLSRAYQILSSTEIRLPAIETSASPGPDLAAPVLTGPYDTMQLEAITAEPVTVTVSRTPQPGRSAALATALDDLAELARNAPGNLGVGVFAPGVPDGPWQLVARFESPLALRAWEQSPERVHALTQIDHLVDDVIVAATHTPDAFLAAQVSTSSRRPLSQIVSDTLWYLPGSVAIVVLLVPHLMTLELVVRLAITGLVASVFSFFVVRPLRHFFTTHRNRRAPLR